MPRRSVPKSRSMMRAMGDRPVKENEEYVVTIEAVSRRGDGVARIQGFIVFVPNTKKRDRVRIRITSVRPRFAIGEVTDMKI